MKMKRDNKTSLLVLILLIIITIFYSIIPQVEARKYHGSKNKKKASLAPPPPNCADSMATTFDILSFGAKGDGVSDDSQAFLSAWNSACKVYGATINIPSGFRFLIKPLTLQGPCMPHLTLQVRICDRIKSLTLFERWRIYVKKFSKINIRVFLEYEM